MHKFKADREKNRLYMHMEGFYSEKQMELAAASAMLEAEKLQPGYTVINNIANLHFTDMQGLRHIQDLMKFACDRGIGRVIRLVDNSLSKLQYGTVTNNADYEVIEVKTLEDVEKYLEENGL